MSSFKSSYQYQFFDRKTALNDPVFSVSPASRVKQTHSSHCVVADGPFKEGEWVEADAIVTRTPNLPIGVITADCAPILLASDMVVGAVHAGWQGAVSGVIESAVQSMECDPKTIQAFIGPCISKRSYEVSKGFERPFIDKYREAERFFTAKNDEKLFFDLKGYCAFRLQFCGVETINVSGIDTLTNENYHSHRGGAGARERNLSVIMING